MMKLVSRKCIINYKNSLKINPNDYAANYNTGDLFLRKNLGMQFLFKKAYDLNQKYTIALASYIFCKMSLCDWSALEDFEKVKNDIGIKEIIHPFYTLNLIDDLKIFKYVLKIGLSLILKRIKIV